MWAASSFISADERLGIACERAVAELRFGRPIVLETEFQHFAVLSLDTATPEGLERFAAISGRRQELFVTAERARTLGLGAATGVLFSVGELSYAALVELAYGIGSVDLPAWRSSPVPDAGLDNLARFALLLPAFVCLEIEAGDPRLAGCVTLPLAALDAAPGSDAEFSVVARTRVPLKDVANAEFVVFRGGLAQRDQVAIVIGSPDTDRPVPVRIHSSCITGDLFGSLKCDCGDQLREGILLIAQRGGGMLLYLDQEGRGTGIATKMRAYGYQAAGLDTVDADAHLGFEDDGRRYGAAVAMLRTLGVSRVELLTNNPRKIAALEGAGFDVHRRTPIFGIVTPENRQYLSTKAERAGHLLTINGLSVS